MSLRYITGVFPWECFVAYDGKWRLADPDNELEPETRWMVFQENVTVVDESDGTKLPIDHVSVGNGEYSVLELRGPAVEGDSARLLRFQVTDSEKSLTFRFELRYPDRTTKDEHDWQGMIFDRVLDHFVFLTKKELELDKPVPDLVNWSVLLDKLGAQKDEAPYSLIVQLSDVLSLPLTQVHGNPRKILQRIREPERLPRVRETDVHCLIDLCRRPGTTIREKAGSSQRILAIRRRESINTLENQVAKDCRNWAMRSARKYVENNRRLKGQSERVAAVEKLYRTCSRLERDGYLESVKTLKEPCRMPNYALLQNIYYSKIWDAYSQLVRDYDLRAEVWRWSRGQWMDFCLIAISKSLDEQLRLMAANPITERVVQARRKPVAGRWMKPDSGPGPWILPNSDGGRSTLYLADRDMQRELLPPLMFLNADYCLIRADSDAVQVMPVYCIWFCVSVTEKACEGYQIVQEMVSRKLNEDVRLLSPLLLIPAPLESRRPPPRGDMCEIQTTPEKAELEQLPEAIQEILDR